MFFKVVLVSTVVYTVSVRALIQGNSRQDQASRQFRFLNLGENCSMTYNNNWELYDEFVNLSKSAAIEIDSGNSSGPYSAQVVEFVRRYGSGQICHPKYTCIPPGLCECRLGFTYEINNYVSQCQVDTGYACIPFARYYNCGSNRFCGLARNYSIRPMFMPGPIGELVREYQTFAQIDNATGLPTDKEYVCVCLPGRNCTRATVQETLEYLNSLRNSLNCQGSLYCNSGVSKVILFVIAILALHVLQPN